MYKLILIIFTMSLHEQIRGEIKDAMKARDAVRLSTVRNMITAFTNELVATGKMPQDMLDDEGALKVIKRLSNQRKDSIEQFISGGRPELAEVEKAELTILDKYLPAMMPKDEIMIFAQIKKNELGITDKAKAGQLTGVIMKALAGKADGGDVKAVVDELFG